MQNGKKFFHSLSQPKNELQVVCFCFYLYRAKIKLSRGLYRNFEKLKRDLVKEIIKIILLITRKNINLTEKVFFLGKKCKTAENISNNIKNTANKLNILKYLFIEVHEHVFFMAEISFMHELRIFMLHNFF